MDVVASGIEAPPSYFGHAIAMNKAEGIPETEEVIRNGLVSLSIDEVAQEVGSEEV